MAIQRLRYMAFSSRNGSIGPSCGREARIASRPIPERLPTTTALLAILAEWISAADLATRAANLTSGISGGIALRWGETVHDDWLSDCLNGNSGADWLLMVATDCQYWLTQEDLAAQ
jgi:hypothetical protein